jgi:ribosomal protein L37E
VILATPPERSDFERFGYSLPSFEGVRHIGKRYPVGLVLCPRCHQRTFMDLSSQLCRACGVLPGDVFRAWLQKQPSDHALTKFVRLPRPAGRGVA